MKPTKPNPTKGLAKPLGDMPLTKPVRSRKVTIDVPEQWDKDPLSAHWAACSSNMVTNFATGSDEIRYMQAVDSLFVKITTNLINSKELVVALLLLRTHSAYRAATVLAASGMSTDIYATLRTVLETAGYALIMHDTPGMAATWLERHTDDAHMAAVKSKYNVGAIKKAITEKAKDAGLLKVFEALYTRTIDMGGHPNERSLTSTMTLTEDEQRKVFNVEYIQGNTLGVKLAMKTAAQVGLCALYIFQHTMKARFEILGLREEMNKLRQSGL